MVILNNMSKNGVAILLLIASLLGLEITEGQAYDLLNAIGTIVSLAVMIYNQWDRDDIHMFFFRKK